MYNTFTAATNVVISRFFLIITLKLLSPLVKRLERFLNSAIITRNVTHDFHLASHLFF